MEGIGAEVSQKIRSAIKAKLMELGAYVDEELPDYIMVMVANKRSKQQMENDLDLFLGESAAVFTTWLHQVLSKLQEVTVSSLDNKKSTPVEDVDKKKKPVSSEDHRKEKEKKKKAKKEKEKEDEKVRPKSKLKEGDPKQEGSHGDANVDKDVNTVQKSGVQNSAEPACPVTISIQEGTAANPKAMDQIDDDDDDFINIKADAETDLWEGETEEMPLSEAKKTDKQNVEPKFAETAKHDSSHEETKLVQRIDTPPKQAELPESEMSVGSGPEKKSSVTAPPARPTPASRIIKISEALREEKETLNPSLKRNLDDKRQLRRPETSETSEKKSKTSVTPIVFDTVDEAKEDDEGIFGRHIASELRLLNPRQRSLAKLKIQQVLYQCQESLESRSQPPLPSEPGNRTGRRRKGAPRRPERGDRGGLRSPIRPPEKLASTIRRPIERKRSPFRFGAMRMDSPAYNRPKPKISS